MPLAESKSPRRTPELLTQRLIRVLRLLDREARITLDRTCGLRILDWRILASVAQSSPIAVRTLADQLFISRSEASRSAAVLVEAGLVVKLDDPDDGRSCLFKITAKGNNVYRRVLPIRQQFMDHMIDQFSAEERDCFNRVLDKLCLILDSHTEKD